MCGRLKVDIEFQNLSYSLQDKNEETGYKNILKNLYGTFGSGNLTAILGSSGAGKSTLLNILAGYISSGVTGSITVNKMPRNMKTFNKISTYIMQDDLVQPYLTIRESMMIAANLKMNSNASSEDKKKRVDEVTSLLGLNTYLEVRTEHISGGQRKLLSIALELVSNPPVILLDEPTTGLDNVATKYCMQLLNSLARQGRTIICTMHQPANSIFQFIDNVYFMADGRCTYNGPVDNLVSFLSTAGFPCPKTYSPWDYIIEVSQLSTQNIDALSAESFSLISNYKKDCIKSENVYCIYDETSHNFQINFWMQFYILVKRNFLQISRNRTPFIIQMIHHILSGLLLGTCFYGIGNNASMAIVNFKFCLCVLIFFLYTHTLSPVLAYPSERKYLEREYFNRWYSLKAYYCTITITPLPSMFLLGFVFTSIVYTMSNQPMDLQRFINFTFAGILTGIASHGVGLAVGCVLNAQSGACIAPSIVAPLAVLSIYGMGYSQDIHAFMKIIIQLTYVRYGLVGLCNALYNERDLLECSDEIFCYYADSKTLMKSVGMEETSYIVQVTGMMFFMFLHKFLAYRLLKFKLNPENSRKINRYQKLMLSFIK